MEKEQNSNINCKPAMVFHYRAANRSSYSLIDMGNPKFCTTFQNNIGFASSNNYRNDSYWNCHIANSASVFYVKGFAGTALIAVMFSIYEKYLRKPLGRKLLEFFIYVESNSNS